MNESLVAIIGTCSYCGIEVGTYRYETARIPGIKMRPIGIGVDLAVQDHLIPKCKGGSNVRENLLLACASCNGSKGKKMLEEFRHHFYCGRFGIPKFNEAQRDYLMKNGFSVELLDAWKSYKFPFELEAQQRAA